MTDMDGAPPSPSRGDNGGFNSSGVRDHLLWAMCYGVASAIALRTIDALTSKRTTSKRTTNQPAGSEKPKEKVEEDKTTTTATNPTVCHVNVFPPSVTTITNSKDSSTLVTKKEDQPSTASSTPTKVSEKDGSNTAVAVAASNGGVLGRFSRPQAPQAKAQLPPPICKHVLDFYYDCLHVASEKKCEGYINLTEKCHQMGPTSADISNVSDDRQNSTLHPPAELLHMSYHGCRKKNQYDSCRKYLTYISETSQNS